MAEKAKYDPAKKRKYYLENREACKERIYKNRLENPEKIKKQQKDYHVRNKEKRNAASKAQRLKNLEKRRQYDRNRARTEARRKWTSEWGEKSREHKNLKERLRRKNNPERYRDKDRNHKLRRKRLKTQNGNIPYKAKEIFLRDKYICHICGQLTLQNSKCPHPRYPTIDHLIPLSKGGIDAPINVKTACYSCNSRKNNRLLY